MGVTKFVLKRPVTVLMALLCLIVFGIPLALGAYLAATAEPYTYALQDLPSWLTGTYGAREDGKLFRPQPGGYG